MPSIPQSLLWISLVVLWLFVLVPMLINKRDTVRRTSDVALATRVLNGGAKSRLFKRSGPAAGHRHDPDWQGDGQFTEDYPDLLDESEDYSDQREAIMEYDDAVREARMGARTRQMVVVAAVTEQTFVERDYLDVEVVDENSGALPVGGGVQASLFDAATQLEEPIDEEIPSAVEPEHVAEQEPVEEPQQPVAEPIGTDRLRDGTADEYEYVDDTSGLEVEDEPQTPLAPRGSSRQRRLESTSAAVVSARKYRFRKRVLIAMAAIMVVTAVLSFTVNPALWWSCGAAAGVMVLYLAYLRRQTRIEAQVRRRRQQRAARSRPLAEDAERQWRPGVDFTEFPTRLQRPGSVELEIDDEDPVFEHLDERPYSRDYRLSGELPRAAGQ